MARLRKEIGLPLSKVLSSNKLEDIQHHFELYKEALDNMYKRLLSDIITPSIGGGGSDGWLYFGGKNVAGSARIGLVGTDWVCQHFIGGTYTSRLGSSP